MLSLPLDTYCKAMFPILNVCQRDLRSIDKIYVRWEKKKNHKIISGSPESKGRSELKKKIFLNYDEKGQPGRTKKDEKAVHLKGS